MRQNIIQIFLKLEQRMCVLLLLSVLFGKRQRFYITRQIDLRNLLCPKDIPDTYYDLYVIAHSEYKIPAFEQKDLLKKVADFKMKFYPRKWAEYENAKIGSLKLVPPEYRLKLLKEDYKNMEKMFYSDFPDFDSLINYIYELEKEINSI